MGFQGLAGDVAVQHRTKGNILSRHSCSAKVQMSYFSKIEMSPGLLFWRPMEGMEDGEAILL